MGNRVLVAVALLCLAALCSGCQPTVCERAGKLSDKKGDCASAVGDPLAPASTCTSRASGCSEAEQQAIGDALTCLEKLSSCSAGSEASYLASEATCLAGFAALSQACAASLFGGVIPGVDAGTDAGTADAGRQPMDGGAVELIAVADETSMALAWSPLQAGQVAKWELSTFDDGGRTDSSLTPGSRRALMLAGVAPLLPDGGPGASVERSFFITGLLNDGTVVMGAAPDAGNNGFMCQGPFGCPANQICDLGMCRTEACSVSNPACPAGYDCPSGTCVRSADAGVFDAGSGNPTGNFVSLPFISNLATARTGPPGWTGNVPVGGFVGKRPDMVAIDSARQFVAMEQESQPVGHLTVKRGKDLLSDLETASVIDSVGDHVKVTYVPDSDTIFACYNVGRGVRVRRSRDHGRTWGNDALTFEPADDGGFTSRMHSCALAPWRNGSALMVNVDDDSLVVRTITEALSVQTTELAFLSSPPDGGGFNVYNPVHPAIGTAPDAGIVHVAFTGQRVLASASDYEVYDVVRTPGLGGYSQPKFINQNLPLIQGNGQNQGYPSVAVDPLSGRAVAAFTAVEGTYSNVYVSLYSPTANEWTTGSDLQVFVKQTTECLLFPARNCSGINDWDAFSPTVRASPDGKIWLGFIAGKQAAPPATVKTDYRPWAVRVDFRAQSPVGGLGWFIRPAEKMGETVIMDPRQGGAQIMPTLSSLAVDGQLSVYGAYVEGLGAFNELENRAVYFSRP